MADNITLSAGSGGATLAADEIAGIQHQRVKIQFGTDGSASDVSSGTPLPITGTVDTELTTADLDTGAGTDTRAVVGLVFAASGGATMVSAANPLPVTGAVTVSGAVDTELPTAVSLADNTNNPSVPGVGAFGLIFDGTTWDRMPGTSTDGLLVNLGGNNDVVASGTVTSHQGTAQSAANGWPIRVSDGTNLINVGDNANTAVRVNIVAGTSGASATDDAAFTVASGLGTPVMGLADETAPDSVNEGDVGVLRMTLSRKLLNVISDPSAERHATVRDTGANDALNVAIVDAAGNQMTTFSETQFAEDAVHTTGDLGSMALGIRRDADTTPVSADNDYHPLVFDNAGNLKVHIKAGAGSGGTAAIDNSAFTGGTTNVTPLGAIFDATPPTITDGSVGVPRMNTNRDLRAHLVDGSGDSITDDANNAVRVNIIAGAGSGGTASTDDAAFTAGSGSGTPLMGFATADAVDSGDVGVVAMTVTRSLHVTLRDSVGDSAMDDANNAVRANIVAGSVTITGTVDTELPGAATLQDNTPNPTVASLGMFAHAFDGTTWDRLRGDSTDGLLVNLGANNDITVTSTTTLTPGTGATNLGKAEDAAHTTGDVGVMALAVRTDTPINRSTTDADYEPLQMSAGRLWTSAVVTSTPTSAIDDAAFTAASGIGTPIMGFVTTDQVQSGDVGAVNMSIYRCLHTTLRDESGESAMDDANNAVRVSVVAGSFTAVTDDTAFAPGTTDGIPLMAFADETATDSVDEGDVGAVRMTLSRKLLTVLSDPSAERHATVRDTGSNDSLNVSIVDASGNQITSFGGAGGTSMVDDAAFTPGTTQGTPALAMFDDAAPDSVDEGDAGIMRMSANRNLYITLRDAAGNERGAHVNASNALLVAQTGAIPAGTNNIGDVDVITLPNVTIGTMANLTESLVDDAAFTPGTSRVLPIGFEFDDAAPDSVNEGDIGAGRMSANRNQYVQIRDAAGNERGLNVDAAGNIGVTDAGGVLTVDGSVSITGTVDTELSNAVALADNTVNPTVASLGAFNMVFDGTNWDRLPGTSADGALVNLGANNDVTVTGTVTANLAAGTNNIGDIDVLSVVPGTGATALGKAEDAVHASGDTGVYALAVRDDDPAAHGGTDGDYESLHVGAEGGLWTSPVGSARGGSLIFQSIDLDETEEQVKATAGTVYGMWVTNQATATRWVKFYNDTAANVVVGTTTPVVTIGIPGNSSDDISGAFDASMGLAFSTAITVAATTGVAVADAGAPGTNDVIINVFYR